MKHISISAYFNEENRMSNWTGRSFIVVWVSALAAMSSTAGQAQAQTLPKEERRAIQEVLDAQVVAWNHGDIDGFMKGYWNSSELAYIGNETLVQGYQGLLDYYHRAFAVAADRGAAEMGELKLTEEVMTPLGKDAVIVWGKFTVTTKTGTRGGPYTLAMHKFPEGWRTVYDRTSSKAVVPKSST